MFNGHQDGMSIYCACGLFDRHYVIVCGLISFGMDGMYIQYCCSCAMWLLDILHGRVEVVIGI